MTTSGFPDDKYTRALTIHLVGGAVRDELLGHVVRDRDWVVTGSSPDDMLARGFRPVGKDFPVFLHPLTHEEYALARTERKVARGYQGFTFHADPTVTLEQDLARRDITINAMAWSKDGELIDPFGGVEDLKANRLRHVSDAFSEDPVRILRIARFAARFSDPRFIVADETRRLIAAMVVGGEAGALVAERVWQELAGALPHRGFYRFIEVLRETGALEAVLPEIDRLFGVVQDPQYHPEIDTGVHVLMSLQAAARLGASPIEAFAVLTHDLGKALTPANILPGHHGHERRGLEPVDALCSRLRVPGDYRDLALRVCEYHLQLHRLDEMKPGTILKLLLALDGFRNPHNVTRFALCCKADAQGRTGLENKPYPQADLLKRYLDAAAQVDSAAIAREVATGADPGEVPGEKIAEAIRRQRVAAIQASRAAASADTTSPR